MYLQRYHHSGCGCIIGYYRSLLLGMRRVERAPEIHLIMQFVTNPRGRNILHEEREYNWNSEQVAIHKYQDLP
jgi:hypothetical protein